MDLTEVLAPVRDLGSATNAAASSLGSFIRDQRVAAQISVRQLAKKAGVSNPYLSQVERGLRRPSAEILAQIAHGLQISVESLLTMAGILDDPGTADGRPGVLDAIAADPLLTERQKFSLVQIYGAFRRETEAARGTASTDGSAVAVPGAPSAHTTDRQSAAAHLRGES